MSSILVMDKREQARPFLKWAGGKQSLAQAIVECFPQDFGVYFEPFLGGGSVFFALRPLNGLLSDENEWLIDTYRAIRDSWQRVASILDTLPNTKEDFLRIRTIPFRQLSRSRRAAHLIYLNKTCFRGLFRVNREGMFNVPYGAYQRRYYSRQQLAEVSAALQNIELRNADFEAALGEASTRDFVYLDPPYYKLGGYSDFNRYTATKFKEKDHLRLASLCREMTRRGIRWALSNSETEFIRKLYKGFNVRKISARREINLNSGNRNITELLITNY